MHCEVEVHVCFGLVSVVQSLTTAGQLSNFPSNLMYLPNNKDSSFFVFLLLIIYSSLGDYELGSYPRLNFHLTYSARRQRV